MRKSFPMAAIFWYFDIVLYVCGIAYRYPSAPAVRWEPVVCLRSAHRTQEGMRCIRGPPTVASVVLSGMMRLCRNLRRWAGGRGEREWGRKIAPLFATSTVFAYFIRKLPRDTSLPLIRLVQMSLPGEPVVRSATSEAYR